MIKSKKETGFTLIELLVVVAIIGLLAAVTMGYLSSAKKKGNDTAVKSNLATIRTVSEIYYTNNSNTYLPTTGFGSTFGPGLCPSGYSGLGSSMFRTDLAIANALAVAVAKGTGNYCYNDANGWAIAIGLNLDPTKSWCVDSKPSAALESSIPSLSFNAVTHLCN